jgi:hypothetical protein
MPSNAATAWLANERDQARALATSGRERRGTNPL